MFRRVPDTACDHHCRPTRLKSQPFEHKHSGKFHMIVKVAHGEIKGVYSRNSQAVQMLCRGNRSSNSLVSRRPTALQCTPLICALPDCTLNGHEDAGPRAQLGVLLERSEKDTAMIHSLSRSSKHGGPASLLQVRFSRQPHLAQLFCTRLGRWAARLACLPHCPGIAMPPAMTTMPLVSRFSAWVEFSGQNPKL